ncbi:hypothetical protein EAF00_000876 [Botryotinia globosa]|nr:hypothetical protein EAF00_000876 [Botryotinia globosa]
MLHMVSGTRYRSQSGGYPDCPPFQRDYPTVNYSELPLDVMAYLNSIDKPSAPIAAPQNVPNPGHSNGHSFDGTQFRDFPSMAPGKRTELSPEATQEVQNAKASRNALADQFIDVAYGKPPSLGNFGQQSNSNQRGGPNQLENGQSSRGGHPFSQQSHQTTNPSNTFGLHVHFNYEGPLHYKIAHSNLPDYSIVVDTQTQKWLINPKEEYFNHLKSWHHGVDIIYKRFGENWVIWAEPSNNTHLKSATHRECCSKVYECLQKFLAETLRDDRALNHWLYHHTGCKGGVRCYVKPETTSTSQGIRFSTPLATTLGKSLGQEARPQQNQPVPSSMFSSAVNLGGIELRFPMSHAEVKTAHRELTTDPLQIMVQRTPSNCKD